MTAATPGEKRSAHLAALKRELEFVKVHMKADAAALKARVADIEAEIGKFSGHPTPSGDPETR